MEDIGLTEYSKILCFLLLSSGAARSVCVLPALCFNASIIIPKKLSSKCFWEIIEKYEPDGMFYLGKTLLELLVNRVVDMECSNTIEWAVGFGTVEEMWRRFERRFGIPLYECWGMAEFGYTINKLGSKHGKFGSIGKPPEFLELKIVDNFGVELPPGPHNYGEIIVKQHDYHRFEYYKPPANSVYVMEKNGWLYTGDLAYKGSDGYIYLKGRKIDLIAKAGEEIFARDIEKIVNSHPHIVDSAFFSLKNEKYNLNDIYLFIQTRKGFQVDFKMMTLYLQQYLPFFLVPRYMIFKDKLPRYYGSEVLKWKLKKEVITHNHFTEVWDSQQMAVIEKYFS